ncbi:MAG TPA: hypothetical protein VFI42_06780, partial [Thermomicrobiaceae bacterium]|nr:hypothetical protein [Thermomicrobiaceae bacterium]
VRKEIVVPLFVVEHQHPPERCPAAAEWGGMLLAHLSAATAARYGVAIQAEAIVAQPHRIILILEAAEREQIERFMRFYQRFGPVTISLASTSEAAVARGGCAVPEAASGSQNLVDYGSSGSGGSR